MKILFMGTPRFAEIVLSALLASDRHEVVGVVAQPDRALKRGKTEFCRAKMLALERGIPVFQPEKIRDCVEQLKSFGADIGVTAAYGQLLTSDVLNAFPKGVINVHASLLPKYRGASPIYSAILNGETETGVTIMRTELGLDTGDILSRRSIAIGSKDTATTLTEKLGEAGGELLVETLDGFDGIKPVKQDDSIATKCRTIKKSEEYIDFDRDAERVARQINALSSEPCAKTVINGEIYKIFLAEKAECDCGGEAVPGEVICSDGMLTVACSAGAVNFLIIQAPGKTRHTAEEFLRGRKIPVGAVCGKPQ